MKIIRVLVVIFGLIGFNLESTLNFWPIFNFLLSFGFLLGSGFDILKFFGLEFFQVLEKYLGFMSCCVLGLR